MSAESRRALEAIIMVTDSPLEAEVLAQLTEQSIAEVESQLAELAAEYADQERGFQLAHVAGVFDLIFIAFDK